MATGGAYRITYFPSYYWKAYLSTFVFLTSVPVVVMVFWYALFFLQVFVGFSWWLFFGGQVGGAYVLKILYGSAYLPYLVIKSDRLVVVNISLDRPRFSALLPWFNRRSFEILWRDVHLVGITRNWYRLVVWTKVSMPDEINILTNGIHGRTGDVLMDHGGGYNVLEFPFAPWRLSGVARAIRSCADDAYIEGAWWTIEQGGPRKAAQDGH